MSSKSILLHVHDTSSLEKTEELIRQRAYEYYEERGHVDGYDMEDWLRAEADILGKKRSESASKPRAARAGAA